MKFFEKKKYANKTVYNLLWGGVKITRKKRKDVQLPQISIDASFQVPINYLFMNSGLFGEKEKYWYIAKRSYECLGYYPNLSNPKTFNEKIHWMNLNYFNPVEALCNDKIDFKNYIKEKLGDGYTTKLLEIYNSIDDIDLEKLPKQFVIKNTLTGDDNGVKIIRNKDKLDIDKFKYDINNIMQQWTSGYYVSLNRNSNKPVRIFAEEYLGDLDDRLDDYKCLDDYKFMCFNGKVKLGYVDVRIPGERGKIYYFDKNWNLLPIIHYAHPGESSYFPSKPENLDKMIEIAEFLAKEFPFVRVDFYNVKGKLYLGELTFNPDGGFGKFNDDWDLKLGEMLDLSKIDKKYLKNDKAKEYIDSLKKQKKEA